jgi:hypothetical protein
MLKCQKKKKKEKIFENSIIILNFKILALF